MSMKTWNFGNLWCGLHVASKICYPCSYWPRVISCNKGILNNTAADISVLLLTFNTF